MSSDLPKLNESLIQAVLTQIQIDPESWDQDNWAQRTPCGTTLCFAGWTAQLSPEVDLVWSDDDGLADADRVQFADGSTLDVGDFAQNALGLTTDEADTLFLYTDTRIEAVESQIAKFKEARS